MLKRKKHHLTKKGLARIKKELKKLDDLRLSKIKKDAPHFFSFGNVDPEYLIFQVLK